MSRVARMHAITVRFFIVLRGKTFRNNFECVKRQENHLIIFDVVITM